MRAAEERIRLVLLGGTLAKGVRQGDKMTKEDIALEEALFYDGCAERYGWTPDVTDSVPDELLTNMLKVARIRSEVEAEQARRGATEGG